MGTCGLPSWMTAAPTISVIDAAALQGEWMTASWQVLFTRLPAATDRSRCEAGLEVPTPAQDWMESLELDVPKFRGVPHRAFDCPRLYDRGASASRHSTSGGRSRANNRLSTSRNGMAELKRPCHAGCLACLLATNRSICRNDVVDGGSGRAQTSATAFVPPKIRGDSVMDIRVQLTGKVSHEDP